MKKMHPLRKVNEVTTASLLIVVLFVVVIPFNGYAQKLKWEPGVVGHSDFETAAKKMSVKLGSKVEFGPYVSSKLPFFSGLKKTQNVPTEPTPGVNYVKTKSGKILQYGATNNFNFTLTDSVGGTVTVICSAVESNRLIQTSLGQTGVIDAGNLAALNYITERTNKYSIRIGNQTVLFNRIQGVDGKMSSINDRSEMKMVTIGGEQIGVQVAIMRDKEIKREFNGYIFSRGEEVIAAVHAFGFKKNVWIRNDLTNQQKIMIAGIIAGLLLEPNTQGTNRLSPDIPREQLGPLLMD